MTATDVEPMAPEEICGLLQKEMADAVERVELDTAHPHAVIKADQWPKVARFLRDDRRLGFNFLTCISAIDLLADNKLACVYDLFCVPGAKPGVDVVCPHVFAVRVETDRDNPHIPSVADVWPSADWHERESFDLMGIHFDNHPDLRRILCPDDWEGHPLRKDYEFPIEYHGIPGTTEHELTNPRH